MNTFEKLSKIDVSDHMEKKGNFNYLSWVWAVQELRKACPDATWMVRHFRTDGNEVPYMKTDCGYFVEVSVVVDDMMMTQIHPVLDNRNKPIEKPNSFQINTSIQRCLVKAIALHGLGLYIYAGEDLPTGEEVPDIPKDIPEKVGEEAEKDQDFYKFMYEQKGRVGDEAYDQLLKDFGYSKMSDVPEKERGKVRNFIKKLKGVDDGK